MATRAVPAPLAQIPNALTILRLALIPVFVVLMLGDDPANWPAGIVFAVAGSLRTITYDFSAWSTVLLGVITAVGGGVLRDVLTGDTPMIFRRGELYAFAAMGAHARPVPALVIHGTDDGIVAPVNGEQTARQWLATNRLAAGDGAGVTPATVREPGGAGGRAATRRTWTDDDGRTLVEHLEVEGLGHAWSGGNPAGSYTDPRGPDASREMLRFFLEHPHPAPGA